MAPTTSGFVSKWVLLSASGSMEFRMGRLRKMSPDHLDRRRYPPRTSPSRRKPQSFGSLIRMSAAQLEGGGAMFPLPVDSWASESRYLAMSHKQMADSNSFEFRDVLAATQQLQRELRTATARSEDPNVSALFREAEEIRIAGACR